MIIQDCTEKYLDQAIKLGKEFYETSDFPNYMGWDLKETAKNLHLIMTDDAYDFLLLIDDGEVVGMIAGGVLPAFFSKALIAQEQFWYVKPSKRGIMGLKLLDAWEKRMVKKGAENFIMMTLACNRDMAKLFERKKYQKIETIFIKKATL